MVLPLLSYFTIQLRTSRETLLQRQQLIAAEAKYREVYESMMDGFAALDMEGRLVQFNNVYRKLLGYEADELRALTYRDVTPEPWHDFDAEIVESQVLQRGYSDIYQKEYRRKDGLLVPVELRTCLVRDSGGKPAGVWAIVRDTTERKQAEQALRESEERYRRVSSVISDIAFSCCPAETGGYRIDWLTGATERITGYTADELKAKVCWRSIVVEEDQALFNDHVAGLGPGSSGSCELRVRHKDGSVRWIASSAECVLSPDALCTPRLYGGMVDITERKRAEGALRESEEKHRTILEVALDGLWLADTEGRLLEVNEAYCRMSGFSAEELLTMRIHDLEASEAAHTTARIHGIMEQGQDRFESRHRRKDGSIFDVEVCAEYRPEQASPATPARPSTEDGVCGPSGRGHRPRLQQPLNRNQRLRGIPVKGNGHPEPVAERVCSGNRQGRRPCSQSHQAVVGV